MTNTTDFHDLIAKANKGTTRIKNPNRIKLTSKIVDALIALPKLKVLHLNCSLIHYDETHRLLQSLPNLESFSVRGSDNVIKDEALSEYKQRLKDVFENREEKITWREKTQPPKKSDTSFCHCAIL